MEQTEAPTRTHAVVPVAPPAAPNYLALHYLYRRVPTVQEALLYAVVHQRKGDFLEDKPLDPNNVLPKTLERLVAEGQVYALWSQRLNALEETTTRWDESMNPLRPLTKRDHHCRRHRLDRRARTHDSDGC